jgi:hypothetical protein
LACALSHSPPAGPFGNRIFKVGKSSLNLSSKTTVRGNGRA